MFPAGEASRNNSVHTRAREGRFRIGHWAAIAASTSSLAARRAGQVAAASPASSQDQEPHQAGIGDADLC